MQTVRDQSCERGAIRGVIRALKAAGFELFQVHDGEEAVPVTTEAAAIEAAFAVDESRIRFRDAKGSTFSIYCVLGNADDGSEVIADHSDDSGPFAATIDAYCRGRGFY